MEGKSQLDLYRIDRATTLNEILDKDSGVECKKIRALLQLLYNPDITVEQIDELSGTIISYIINTHNSKPKSLKFKSKKLKQKTVGNYNLILFEAKSMPKSPIITLLEDRIEESLEKAINLSYILFVYDKNNIFSFCSGAGWQVVVPFVDSLFGLQVMSRLIPENKEAISSVKLRGFAGTIAGQSTNFRKKARASEIIEFGQLFKDLSGHIAKEEALDGLGIEISAKRKNIGADFKNSFKLKKRLTLLEFLDLLDKITELLKTDPYFSVEDWLGLSPLGRSSKDKALIKVLQSKGLHDIYINSLEEKPTVSIFISDPNLIGYSSANSYVLRTKNQSITYDEFNNENDLIEYIKNLASQFSKEKIEEQTIDCLIETTLESFTEDEAYPNTTSSLLKCLQFSVNHEGKNYILIDGQWYIVYEGLSAKLNRELPNLIKARKSNIVLPSWKSGIYEKDYLLKLSEKNSHAVFHQKRPLDNIELCDTMFLDGKKLYLCHVKDDFDTKMRVLSAQVQSSAELINDLKLSNRIDEMKQQWVNYKKILNIPSWEIFEKSILGVDDYQIIECIVFNPSVDFSAITSLNSVIAKYELSSLIKKWQFEFPLEIAIPNKN